MPVGLLPLRQDPVQVHSDRAPEQAVRDRRAVLLFVAVLLPRLHALLDTGGYKAVSGVDVQIYVVLRFQLCQG